jgi:hypothetical protein
MSPKFRKGQRGAEIVELVITLPLMLVIALIFIELAIALSDQAALTNAARAAAREVIRGATDEQAEDAAELVYPSLISWSQEDNPPTVSVDPAMAVRDTDADGEPDNVEGREITVTIDYDFDLLLLPAFLSDLVDFDLRGRSVMYELKY